MKIPQEIINQCNEFAEKTWKSHYNPSNRSHEKIKYEIRLGKIGEWGFYFLYKDFFNLEEPNMEDQNGNDGGVDFYSKKGNIDVKTTDYLYHPNLIFKKTVKSDIYSLCIFDNTTSEVKHQFSIDLRKMDKSILPEKENFRGNYALNDNDIRELKIPTISFEMENDSLPLLDISSFNSVNKYPTIKLIDRNGTKGNTLSIGYGQINEIFRALKKEERCEQGNHVILTTIDDKTLEFNLRSGRRAFLSSSTARKYAVGSEIEIKEAILL